MIGKQTKKLTLGRFFLKRFIPLVIAAAILCFAGIAIVDSVFELEIGSMTFQQISKVQETILENGDKELGAHASMYVGLYSDASMETKEFFDPAVIIIDPDTGEPVITPELAVYAVVRADEESKPSYYICRDKDVVDFYMKHRQPEKILNFDTCYIKDGSENFRPGVVTVTYDDLYKSSGEAIADECDFTPADLSGYSKETAKLSICTGTTKDSRAYQMLIDTVVGKPSAEAYRAIEGKYVTTDITSFHYDTLRLGDKKYDIYAISYFNFRKMCGMWILAVCAVVLAIVAIVSFVWAKLAYSKYSAKYEADEYRRTMVNALAHDLKSPLMAISGYAENLQSGAHPEKNAHYTGSILENTRYMNDIIENVLQLSKLEGVRKLTKEQVNAAALTAELFEKYRLQAENRHISFSLSGECTVTADKALLEQALENLISNAARYTDDGGSITVKADQKSLTIANSFSGKLTKTCEELCRPFVKGDNSRTDHNGTGMGLALAKNICEMHSFGFDLNHENRSFTAKITF